jgi:atlastin
LKGFSWKPGVTRNTTGIVFWSDVFLYDSDDGDKYAILLIDTQGLFDHDTPPAMNAKIFSFTTLISSLQIFNLANMFQEDHLEYLQVQLSLIL